MNVRVVGFVAYVGCSVSVARAQCPDGSPPPCGARRAVPAMSVAVLPFRTLGPDASQQYFADGIADAVLNALASLPNLKVTARGSSFVFRNTDLDVRRIADSLRVATIVEGSVLKSGDRVRVAARLIDARAGTVLWASTIDRRQVDVFDLMDEVSRAIADKLTPAGRVAANAHPTLAQSAGTLPTRSVSPVRRLVARTTSSADAHDLFLRGRQALYLRTRTGIMTAIDHFRGAIHADPKFSAAYAGLATTYSMAVLQHYAPPESSYTWAARSLAAAERAIALDPTNAEAYASRASARWQYRAPPELAQWDFNRALDLKPGHAETHGWYAQFSATYGRPAEARPAIARAVELDPLSPGMQAAWISTASLLQDWAEVVRAVDSLRSESLPQGFPALAQALAYIRLGRPAGCLAARSGLESLCLHALGRTREARARIDSVTARTATTSAFGPPYESTLYFAMSGDTDAAIRWMERAFEESPIGLNLAEQFFLESAPGVDWSRIRSVVEPLRTAVWQRVSRDSHLVALP